MTHSNAGQQCVSHAVSLDLFEQQMPNLGLQPDVITYNSLLRALGRSKDGNLAATVLHLYDKLCHSSELTPDKHTFSAVFSAAMQLNITDGSYLLQVQLSLVCLCHLAMLPMLPHDSSLLVSSACPHPSLLCAAHSHLQCLVLHRCSQTRAHTGCP